LLDVKIIKAKKLNVSAEELENTLKGQVLRTVARSGKELHFHFDHDTLGLHLMLKGRLVVFEKLLPDYTVLALYFENANLAMTDFQGQATPTLNPEVKDAPDALADDMAADYLADILSKKKSSIKSVLLDQKMIRGIGNAYADEILWEAGIAPLSVANKIPKQKIQPLVAAIKNVLQDAERQILDSHPDIIAGEVRDFLQIHNAKKKTSPRGAAIKFEMVNGRKTYFTEEQELFE